ncbi:MAG: hypothetical protein UIG59_05320 [Acutalibacteraceae bacterium]|nr:hypothetical protein [Acutalibacteraceae bacterium]
MNILKKLLCITLALLLVTSLAACGGDAESSTTQGGSSSQGQSNNDSQSGSSGEGESSSDSDSQGTPSYDRPQDDPNTEYEEEEQEEKIWTGKISDGDLKGGGTEELPYLIYTPSQLAYALTKGGDKGYCYQLQNDIYLNDVSDKNWMKNKNNIPWVTEEFVGSIDGNGFCIYGIWFDPENAPKNAGLMNKFSGGKIKNLGIRNSFILAKEYAGGFAGIVNAADEASFENCFVDETVFVQYTTNGNHGAGGIIGYCNGGSKDRPALSLENCYSKAQVAGLNTQERVNGIIGTSWTCSYTMKNCYSVGYAPYFGKNSNTASKLLTGGAKKSEVYSNIYTDARSPIGEESFTQLSTSKMKGNGAKSSMKLDFSNTFETVSGGFPKLRIFKDISGKDVSVPSIENLSFQEREFKNGKGTEASPFIITTAEELRKVVSSDWPDTYFELGGNIKDNNTSGGMWAVMGNPWETGGNKSFAGHFDGKGYTVSGLCLNESPAEGEISSENPVGLFPKVNTKATICNVKLSNCVFSGKSYVGGIVGMITGGGKNSTEYLRISGCSVDSTVYLTGQTVGGIFGGGGGGVEISDCIFTGNISNATGSDDFNNRGNGIVGDIWSSNYKLIRCVSPEYPAYRKQFVPKEISAVYSSVELTGVTVLDLLLMKGSSAKTNMPDLDWAGRWITTTKYPTIK